jgi:hypothetical protein
MGHYAKIEKNKVVEVVVASSNYFDAKRDTLFKGEWIKTSYNTHGGIHYNSETNEPSENQTKALRKNFAGIGYTYDRKLDAFIPPKPYPSWLLDKETCTWNAPAKHPSDDSFYIWDEEKKSWVEETIE